MRLYSAKKTANQPASEHNPFPVMLAPHARTEQPYPPAQVHTQTRTLAWFGPASRAGWKSNHEWHSLASPHIRSPENTILFCDNQMIAVALTEADFDGMPASGINAALIGLAGRAGQDGSDAFGVLRQNEWQTALDRLITGGLPALVAGHYNWAIPADQIAAIRVDKVLGNDVLRVDLRDGTTLKWLTRTSTAAPRFAAMAHAAGLHVAGA